jgi:tetratricopeptide (TPR) repeat protein
MVALVGGYGAREVAKMLGLSVAQVRAYVKAGFLEPSRGPRGELRFSFQDLVLLRTAKGLVSARIPPRRVRTALRKLKAQLPEGRPLRAVHIHAEGDNIVVGDGASQWSPESGQVLFDFSAREISRAVAPAQLHARDAGDFYERGCDLEESEPAEAQDAYRRALQLDPSLADAWVNLGRLHHEAGNAREAAQHYRKAIELRPDDVIALFNLGVALEDLQMREEAVLAYRTALAADPGCADAHYNLAHLYERLGQPAPALRHLRSYRKLVLS